MLSPKKTKFRKAHKGRIKGKACRCNAIDFGDFALQAVEPAKLGARQIEASRVAIARYAKKVGKMFIRIFPDKPVSRKPAETRMGGGKGAPEYWVAVIKPGRILFEMEGVDAATAKQALTLAAHKLPLRTKFIQRGVSL